MQPRLVPTTQQPPRALSFALVLILHLFLVYAVLYFLVKPQTSIRRPAESRVLEMIISTARPPPPAPTRTEPRVAPASPAPLVIRPSASPSITLPAAPPDITGFGQSLFGCAPETLANLLPDQRAHCKNGFVRPNENAMVEPRSHVKDPARRAAEMRANNGSIRVQCTNIIAAPVGGGTVQVPIVDPLCALQGKMDTPLNGLSK